MLGRDDDGQEKKQSFGVFFLCGRFLSVHPSMDGSVCVRWVVVRALPGRCVTWAFAVYGMCAPSRHGVLCRPFFFPAWGACPSALEAWCALLSLL